MKSLWKYLALVVVSGTLVTGYVLKADKKSNPPARLDSFDRTIVANSNQMLDDGRQIFRFDTFGDDTFWGGQLQLNKAIEGSKFGGVGPGVSPATAAAVCRRN